MRARDTWRAKRHVAFALRAPSHVAEQLEQLREQQREQQQLEQPEREPGGPISKSESQPAQAQP